MGWRGGGVALQVAGALQNEKATQSVIVGLSRLSSPPGKTFLTGHVFVSELVLSL